MGFFNKDLIELQKQYRKGNIKEEEITYDRLQDLKELYNYQISYLEKSIEEDKQKILEIRQRIAKVNN